MRGVAIFHDAVVAGYKGLCILEGVWIGETVLEIKSYGFVICREGDGGSVGGREAAADEAGSLEEKFAWFAGEGGGGCEGPAGWDVHDFFLRVLLEEDGI